MHTSGSDDAEEDSWGHRLTGGNNCDNILVESLGTNLEIIP